MFWLSSSAIATPKTICRNSVPTVQMTVVPSAFQNVCDPKTCGIIVEPDPAALQRRRVDREQRQIDRRHQRIDDDRAQDQHRRRDQQHAEQRVAPLERISPSRSLAFAAIVTGGSVDHEKAGRKRPTPLPPAGNVVKDQAFIRASSFLAMSPTVALASSPFSTTRCTSSAMTLEAMISFALRFGLCLSVS